MKDCLVDLWTQYSTFLRHWIIVEVPVLRVSDINVNEHMVDLETKMKPAHYMIISQVSTSAHGKVLMKVGSSPLH